VSSTSETKVRTANLMQTNLMQQLRPQAVGFLDGQLAPGEWDSVR
jgi:hypothetical protein